MAMGHLQRGIVALGCATLATIGMTASADAATGTVTPAPGDIVYSVAADDTTGGDLWLVHSDGTGATQLTTVAPP
jgi:hypothetical protein